MGLDPQFGLPAASALASFLLRTAVEWLAVLALARTAATARVRSRLWLGMLAAFAIQWLWTLAAIARAVFLALRFVSGPVLGAQIAGVPPAGIAVSSGAASSVALAMAVLLAVYCAGIVWQLLSAALARVRLAHALRHRRDPDRRLLEIFERSLAGRDLRCELWVLPGIASPATLGWLRPRVLLPLACETQEEAELEAVFWHELKHVERRDALWNGVARLCRSLVWLHPGARYALRGLVAERELACDAEVIAEHPEQRDIYATCLVRFARAVDLAAPPAVAAVEMASRATQLTVRVHSILAERREVSVASRAGRFVVCASITAVTLCAVPNLVVLLRAEATTAPLAQAMLSVAVRPGTHPARRVVTTQENATASQVPIALPSFTPAVPHDEALAAEHRVAMGVLTESTGMEQSSGDGNGATADAPGSPQHAGHAPGGWASVAVDAAEHMGPLLVNDHDADDRH